MTSVSQIDSKILMFALRTIIAPIARFCMRHSIKFQDFLDCSKMAFIQVAKQELEANYQEINTSRLSVMTGLQRRDVMKFKATQQDKESGKGLITKVIGQWQTHKKFLTPKGQPRPLGLGSKSEFANLVSSVSQDLNPASVLFELERIGAVEKTEKVVKLTARTFVPKGDVMSGLAMLGRDCDDLIRAVEDNVFHAPHLANHHLRTDYDRVRANMRDELKLWLLKEGHNFQIRARDYIAQFDQDVNPDPNYKGDYISVVLGSFSRIK